MIDGMKVMVIPQVVHITSESKNDEDSCESKEVLKQPNLGAKKLKKIITRNLRGKIPVLKVRQLPIKPLEFTPIVLSKTKEKLVNTSQIIKTRMALNSSFCRKKDQMFTKEKSSNKSVLIKARDIPEVANMNVMNSYKHFTRNKYLLSNSRIPKSEDQFCFAKSVEEAKGCSSNSRISSYLKLFKKRI